MNNKLIVGNLKMNLVTLSERDDYLRAIKNEIKKAKLGDDIEIVLCVPFVHLEFFAKNLKKTKIGLGVQNVFWQERGSFTGEVSPVMVKILGAEYVILGHSERRKYLKETDEMVGKKIITAIKSGLKPILCVGENSGEGMQKIVIEQLEKCLEEVNKSEIKSVVICYEPVWAISSNRPDHFPTANEIMSARLLIKKFLVMKYGLKIAEEIRVIYGGSVSSGNMKEVCVNSGMGGALVGRESLSPENLFEISKRYCF